MTTNNTLSVGGLYYFSDTKEIFLIIEVRHPLGSTERGSYKMSAVISPTEGVFNTALLDGEDPTVVRIA